MWAGVREEGNLQGLLGARVHLAPMAQSGSEPTGLTEAGREAGRPGWQEPQAAGLPPSQSTPQASEETCFPVDSRGSRDPSGPPPQAGHDLSSLLHLEFG